MTPFRQLATGLSGEDMIATATLEFRGDGTDGSVQVWSLSRRALMSEFDTVLDFGGRRLALCTKPDGLVVVAGAYNRHGIAGYDVDSGTRLWHRRDLKQVQLLSPAGDGSSAAGCFSVGSMQVLDAASGTTIATVRAVRSFWQSRYRPVGTASVLGHVALVGTDDWQVRWRAPVAGFALLATAFATDAFLVSNVVSDDSGEACSIYCFSLSGELLWRREVPDGTNAPWLAWDEEAGEWLGVTNDPEQRTPEMLLRFAQDGELLSRVPLGHVFDYAFMPAGRLLVTGRGQIIDTKTARQIGSLPAESAAPRGLTQVRDPGRRNVRHGDEIPHYERMVRRRVDFSLSRALTQRGGSTR